MDKLRFFLKALRFDFMNSGNTILNFGGFHFSFAALFVRVYAYVICDQGSFQDEQ